MSPRPLLLALLPIALLGSSSLPAAADDLHAYDDPVRDPGDDGVGRYYLGGGAAVLGDARLQAAAYLDGGLRIPGRHIWVRGRLATGLAGGDDGDGTLAEATLGVEGRRCRVSGVVCGALGFDAGRVAGELTHDDHMHDAAAWVMALHASGDAAITRSVALRLTVEARRLAGVDEMSHADVQVGAGVALGVVMRF